MNLNPYFKSVLDQDRASIVLCGLDHTIRPEEVRNPLAVHCVGKMEEPFEWIIRMRAEGQTAGSPDLWWRVSKEIVPETMPTRLCVAPEQVLLFYE